MKSIEKLYEEEKPEKIKNIMFDTTNTATFVPLTTSRYVFKTTDGTASDLKVDDLTIYELDTENISEENHEDDFICKACGIHLRDWIEIKIVDDEEIPYAFEFRACPCCGRKIINK